MRTLAEIAAFSLAGALFGLLVGIILVSATESAVDREPRETGLVEHVEKR